MGFRSAVRRKAKELHLLGSVRNLPDGGVEIILFDEKKQLEELLAILRISFSVERVVIEPCDLKTPPSGFEVLYS